MSRRGCDGGRKKGVIDSRRGVNCPVSDCDVSGRIDYVKKHFNKLIVWSKLSYSRLLHDRFRNWVICFQSLIGPTNVNLERKRSQSVQRFIPG